MTTLLPATTIATMAEGADTTNDNAAMESTARDILEVSAEGGGGPSAGEAGVLQFQASQVIARLERAVERAAEGGGEDDNGENGVSSDGTTWNNPSGFLLQAKKPDEILASIQNLVVYEDVPQTTESGSPDTSINQVTALPALTEAARLTLVTHTISAYAIALPKSHTQKLAIRLAADTTRWLSHIFRFFDCAASFNEDYLEGLTGITRLALHRKYPGYMEEGFSALASQLPLIYSSVTAPLVIVQHLCRQLSLPMHCIRPIPHIVCGSKHTMDISALERCLAEDTQSNDVRPLLVLAETNSTLTGHCNNIIRLRAICNKYDVWLHLRGHSLAALALNNSAKDLSTKMADSITLPLGTWLGIPSLPVVTLYRLANIIGGKPTPRDTTLSLVSGLMTDSLSRRLPILPLWAVLQVLGRDGVYNRFKRCFLAVEELYNKIKEFSCIRVLSQPPGSETECTLNEYLTNPVNNLQLFEVVASAIVFQFVPANKDLQSTERVLPYYDKLNSWLGQILQRDIDNVQIELCDITHCGVAIRICPLENRDQPPTSEDIENLVTCLEQQIEILLATVEHKDTFVRLVSENDSLHLVEMPGWAGLGGVRYAPPTWIHVMTEAKEELNKLNTQLVENLRSTDAAFSLGEGADGLACVRFGMVTQDTDVAELLSLVLQVGQEIEASSKMMETISEVVKRGIETAQIDLERENAEKLWQEGFLRHVPVVGTFVNWWNPISKETGVRGRSLNLQAGVVESTENIYRYHMQLQPNFTHGNGSGARTPPQPLIQTPVGANSQSHSRSSSHSSLQSSINVPPSTTTSSPPQVKEESEQQISSSQPQVKEERAKS